MLISKRKKKKENLSEFLHLTLVSSTWLVLYLTFLEPYKYQGHWPIYYFQRWYALSRFGAPLRLHTTESSNDFSDNLR